MIVAGLLHARTVHQVLELEQLVELLHRLAAAEPLLGIEEVGPERTELRHFQAELVGVAEEDHDLGLVEDRHHEIEAGFLEAKHLGGRVALPALDRHLGGGRDAALLQRRDHRVAVALRPFVGVGDDADPLRARLAQHEVRERMPGGLAGLARVEDVLGERRRDLLVDGGRDHPGHAALLDDRPHRERDAAAHAAVDEEDLVLADEFLRDRDALGLVAGVVADDDFDLAAVHAALLVDPLVIGLDAVDSGAEARIRTSERPGYADLIAVSVTPVRSCGEGRATRSRLVRWPTKLLIFHSISLLP